MTKLPRISIVTPSWNSNLPIFERMLKEIKNQTYPRRLIEHIVIDAQSTNGTVQLAKKYGCKVSTRPQKYNQEQVQSSLGIQRAKGDLILLLQADNIMTSNNWLMEMVQPFLDNKKIICTYSAYNGYEKGMNMTTRYAALIGANDPTLYYLNKSEKIPMIQKYYDKGQVLKETKGYYVVKFTKENLPTLGDNGHLFSKTIIDKVNNDPQKYLHTDAFMELMEKGYDTYGVVKNSLIHMVTPDIKKLICRRIQLKRTFSDKRRGKRYYLVFNWYSFKDWVRLLWYIFCSLTLIQPLAVSLYGFTKRPDVAWFLHAPICFLLVVGYGISELQFQLTIVIYSVKKGFRDLLS